MMVSEQRQVAGELVSRTHELAVSVAGVAPGDSYEVLADLRQSVDALAVVCARFAVWHEQAGDGVEYVGEDSDGDGATGTVVAAESLRRAAEELRVAALSLDAAHEASSVIRWRGNPQE